MNSKILDFALAGLKQRDPRWTEVARATGVPYDTLKKIANGTTPNPGVRHVQAIADFFSQREATAGATSTPEQGMT